MTNIYVSNLGIGVNDEELKVLFSAYGEVSSAKIINDKTTGESRGFGFVEMTNDDSAKQAIGDLNEKPFKGGRSLIVKQAITNEVNAGPKNYSKGFRHNKY